jgi:lipoprotein-anchoring transpeptidase ErfK/SrfK
VATSEDASRFEFSRRSTARRKPFRGPLLAGFLAATLLAALVAAMFVYDHARRDVIAHGVRVAGVDLGGLKPAAARRRLDSELIAGLRRPVRVTFGPRTFSITGRQAGVRVNVNALVQEALDRSRSGSIFSRTLRDLFGGSANADIPATVHFDRAAVTALIARVRAAEDRPALDATAQPNASGLLTSTPSHNGLVVNSSLLGARVGYSLTHPGAVRSIALPVHVVRPSVTSAQLVSRYPSYIVVDRNSFTLRLYQHLKLTRSYPIAVGMQGLETPAGLWHIQWMQVDPPWYVPNDSWAGSLAGTVVPPGPADPLKARFMSFDGGAGIHGIDPSEYGTIGHTASHGCIRMTIPDVIDLYGKVRVGTPVYIL